MSLRTGSGIGLWVAGVVLLACVWLAFVLWPGYVTLLVAAGLTVLIPLVLIADMAARGGPGRLWADWMTAIAGQHHYRVGRPWATQTEEAVGGENRLTRTLKRQEAAAKARQDLLEAAGRK